MHIDPFELQAFVENTHKYVSRKESERWPGLFTIKYKNNVFYDNMWHVHPLLLESRGLVVDANYNIIVKPFTKVFNRGENGTDFPLNEEVVAVRKVNGFMGCATYRPTLSEDIIYSTTGSLDSDFVDLIAKHVRPYEAHIKRFPNTTFIFEIVDESDPHIIPEEEGAWLIGANQVVAGEWFHVTEGVLDSVAKTFGCKRPESAWATFDRVVEAAKTCKHEGFMVISATSGDVLKLKSPYYLTTKFLARTKSEKMLRGVLAGDKTKIDEEFYPLVDYLSSFPHVFAAMPEQERIDVIRDFLWRAK